MGYTIEKNSKNLSDLFIKDQSDPFFSYEFLNSLEKNNCLDEDSGWSANYFHHKNNSFIPFYEKIIAKGSLFLIIHGLMLSTIMAAIIIQN